MMLNKIIKKLKQRYEMIKNHPISGKHPVKGLLRYLCFNMTQYIIRKPKRFNWIKGLRFYAEKGDAGIVGNIYYRLMDYEESSFLMHTLSSEDLFVDVGANLGHYSLLAGGICKSKVIALEPIIATVNKLKRNIELNHLEQNITVLNCGVGEKAGVLKFTKEKTVMNHVATPNDKNTVSVKVDTLDTILKLQNPTFLKIDVEGYELSVLKGAHKILSNNTLKYLLVEFNNSGQKFNVNDDEVYSLILNYGFVPCSYNVSQKTISYLSSYNKHKFNTLFIRQRK